MGAKDSKPCFLTFEDSVKRGKILHFTYPTEYYVIKNVSTFANSVIPNPVCFLKYAVCCHVYETNQLI